MKYVFEKTNYFNDSLIILSVLGLIRIGIAFLDKEESFNHNITSIAIWAVLALILNKKWIYSVKIYQDNGIEYHYPFTIFGSRTTLIPFSSIQKIKFNGYAYNSPPHFKLKSGNRKFRFNCSENEAMKLFDFFKSKDIEVDYLDENEMGFR